MLDPYSPIIAYTLREKLVLCVCALLAGVILGGGL